MNILIYLVVAAAIGWVATELMHDRSNLLLNIIVAVIGAFLAGYFLKSYIPCRYNQSGNHCSNCAANPGGIRYPTGDRQPLPPWTVRTAITIFLEYPINTSTKSSIFV